MSYTREQADRALPLVRAIVEDARGCYLRLRTDLAAFRGVELLDDIETFSELPPALLAQLGELRGYVRELRDLRATLHDPELGIVSVPGSLGGTGVNFCWKLGEDRVRFWYPADGAYADRRPLDAPLTAAHAG